MYTIKQYGRIIEETDNIHYAFNQAVNFCYQIYEGDNCIFYGDVFTDEQDMTRINELLSK